MKNPLNAGSNANPDRNPDSLVFEYYLKVSGGGAEPLILKGSNELAFGLRQDMLKYSQSDFPELFRLVVQQPMLRSTIDYLQKIYLRHQKGSEPQVLLEQREQPKVREFPPNATPVNSTKPISGYPPSEGEGAPALPMVPSDDWIARNDTAKITMHSPSDRHSFRTRDEPLKKAA